jgi:hypothetical protein
MGLMKYGGGKCARGERTGWGLMVNKRKKRKTHREGKNSEREELHRGRGFDHYLLREKQLYIYIYI